MNIEYNSYIVLEIKLAAYVLLNLTCKILLHDITLLILIVFYLNVSNKLGLSYRVKLMLSLAFPSWSLIFVHTWQDTYV
jgi:hypothetical protein